MPGTRTYAAGSSALELGGKNVGPLRSASGGDAVAEVVTTPGGQYYAKKHIANVSWTPARLELGFGMAQPLYDWLAATWTGAGGPQDAALVEADANGVAKARRELVNALVTAVTVPACDGASKEAGLFTVELTPELVRHAKTGGSSKSPAQKQKTWLSANFKLELDGLDASRVARVDSFTVTQTVAQQPAGARRTRAKQAASVEFPNLRVTLSSTGAQTWTDWFDAFVIQGSSGDAEERNGTLRFLAANLKAELGQVRLFNVGIFKLAAEPAAPGAVKRLVADLYCERMELELKP